MDNNDNKLTNFGTFFNKYMMPLNAPITRTSPLPGYNFEIQNEMQGRFMRASLVNIKNFIGNSNSSDITFTVAPNTIQSITTTDSWIPPHQFDKNFTLPYIALYIGTAAVGTNQIYPQIGAGIATGDFNVWSGFNYNGWDGIESRWTTSITNLTAGTKTFYLISQSKLVVYNSGQT